jgi:hypothetical protein
MRLDVVCDTLRYTCRIFTMCILSFTLKLRHALRFRTVRYGTVLWWGLHFNFQIPTKVRYGTERAWQLRTVDTRVTRIDAAESLFAS